MTLTNISPGATAGSMAHSKLFNFSYTTTVDTYEVIGTVGTSGLPGLCNTIAVTTNNLLFKFEYTRDGTNWVASIEDFPISAAATAQLSAQRHAMMYRVSVKPAVAGSHGSCTWQLGLTDIVLPPEYRAAFTYEALTITNAAAVPLTLATFDGAFTANITVEDNPIRVRWDGGNPTTAIGHLLQSGDQLKLDFTADIWHFRAIATGGNASIKVTYSR